ncbi:hypothetical protein OAC06_08180 [Alphaproteobacteria bacterium]|nr:hypothetical protein [Alphaproteobacteria bacterium]
MKTLWIILFFSFFINHIANANDDVKVIGYTETGNQWLLTLSNKYISTNDPKIFTKEINISLKALLCRDCKYTYNNIVCQQNRNLFAGDEVNCKDEDALFTETEVKSYAKIKCFRKICKLYVKSYNHTGGSKGNNILYEMGDAEFNLADNLIVDKEEKKNEDDVINSNNTSEEVTNDNTSKLEKAKASCLKLGLEVKTEKFADCVLMFY